MTRIAAGLAVLALVGCGSSAHTSSPVRELPEGAIPALDGPRLVAPQRAGLDPSTAVVGIALRGDAHAYPVSLLSVHEIVNDAVGGRPVAVTWCPLCRTAVAFSRRVGDRTLTFRVSGLLEHRNLVLEDRETHTLWPQLTGRAVRGPLAGRRLAPVVATYTSLASWRREHPGTRVLPIAGDRFASRLRSSALVLTQYGGEEAGDPYSAYFQKAALYVGSEPVDVLSPTALVLGAVVAGHPVAVPLEPLAAGRHEVETSGGRLIVVWRPLLGDARAYLVRDLRSVRVPAVAGYWFAWRAFHPDTEIDRPRRPVRLDLRVDEGRPAAFLRRFDPRALYVAALPDQIPAIERPVFESPAAARALLEPSDLVVGLARGGEARAYPENLLSLHEVVNDVVGGEPVAVTWCPLCFTALGFDRRVGGHVLSFGVSGRLYRANQVLFDRRTGSLWSQLLGGAVTGRYRGTSLRPVPLVHETWAAWLAAHPRTLVLSIRHDLYARRFLHPTVETTQRGEAPSDEPYSDYATKVPFYFGRRIEGLPGSALVLGLVVDGRPRAYPLVALRRRHAVDDGRLRIVYDDDAFAASAFLRRAGRLVRLPATLSYWFAWHAIYPDAALLDPGAS